MTTNTAAQICVLIKVIAMVTGLGQIWALPESLHCPGSLDFCEYFQPWRFWLYTPAFLLTLIIVLVVIVFTMYRAHTFREINVSPLPLDGTEMEEHNPSGPNISESHDTSLRMSPGIIQVRPWISPTQQEKSLNFGAKVKISKKKYCIFFLKPPKYT